MIFIRILLLLLFLYLTVRAIARFFLRVTGMRSIFSASGFPRERPAGQDSRKAVEAEYEVIESHIRDDA
jgi:hypothetical protein